MKTNSASYCKRCQFYHGANQVVCGLHPYGPDSNICSDYVPQVSNLDQGRIRRSWIIRQFHDYKGWKKLLMLGLLVAHFEIIKELGENGGGFFATNSAHLHDSFMPNGGFFTLSNMFLQIVFGGQGTGTAYLFAYLLLVVLCYWIEQSSDYPNGRGAWTSA